MCQENRIFMIIILIMTILKIINIINKVIIVINITFIFIKNKIFHMFIVLFIK